MVPPLKESHLIYICGAKHLCRYTEQQWRFLLEKSLLYPSNFTLFHLLHNNKVLFLSISTFTEQNPLRGTFFYKKWQTFAMSFFFKKNWNFVCWCCLNYSTDANQNLKSVKIREDWRKKSRPIPPGGTYPAKDHCRFIILLFFFLI